MMKVLRFMLCAVLTCISPLCAADIPPTINYQGFLTDTTGTPINSSVQITFRLYNVATGGTALWTEIQPSVSVISGNFNVALGAVTPLTSLNFDVPYWLTLAIGADVELIPRQPLMTVPYAVTASSLDAGASVQGSQINGPITTATIGGAQITGTITAATATTALSLSGTITGSQITGNIIAAGNIQLANSTASAGNIFKGVLPFMHNFGSQSTFLGQDVGNFTQTGSDNTAVGALAMQSIADGFNNTAAGSRALRATTSGFQNSAFGASALLSNAGGNNNSALGHGTMMLNVGGSGNTAIGTFSLPKNTAGNDNTAIGMNALDNNTGGSNNIALGKFAGSLVTSGSKNIHIGNVGSGGDSNTIRIGLSGDQTATFIAGIRGTTVSAGLPVEIDTNGRLGVTTSSRAVKDAIEDMGEASNILMKLRPVTFLYRATATADAGPLQYGLIAEEVADVAPGLVAHSANGKIESVYYRHLSPMLLNEFQKQQRTIQAQARELATQRNRMELMERELQDIKLLLGTR